MVDFFDTKIGTPKRPMYLPFFCRLRDLFSFP